MSWDRPSVTGVVRNFSAIRVCADLMSGPSACHSGSSVLKMRQQALSDLGVAAVGRALGGRPLNLPALHRGPVCGLELGWRGSIGDRARLPPLPNAPGPAA